MRTNTLDECEIQHNYAAKTANQELQNLRRFQIRFLKTIYFTIRGLRMKTSLPMECEKERTRTCVCVARAGQNISLHSACGWMHGRIKDKIDS